VRNSNICASLKKKHVAKGLKMRQNTADAGNGPMDGSTAQSVANSSRRSSEHRPDTRTERSNAVTIDNDRQHGIDRQEIAVAAYLRWEREGQAPATADDNWFWAERELMAQREVDGGLLTQRKRKDGKS
jgi:hypothetical protein